MKFSDETLMAYADDELDTETRAAVDAAMAADPDISRRIARHKALREQLHGAFADVLNEPVPQRLVTAARTAPFGDSSNVTSLSDARGSRVTQPERRRSWPQWAAIAASLLVGLFIGRMLMFTADRARIVEHDGQLVAGGALNSALTNQLASQQSSDDAVQIGLSFRAKSGNYCRTFVLRNGPALGGLACRDGDAWNLQTLTQVSSGTPSDGGHRMAGAAVPPAVLHTVENSIAGEPLDAQGEIAARESGWK